MLPFCWGDNHLWVFRSGIVIPWITIIATGIYIAAAGKLVTEGANVAGEASDDVWKKMVWISRSKVINCVLSEGLLFKKLY